MKIDFHTHPVMIKEVFAQYPELERGARQVFGMFFPPQPLEVFLLEMDAAGVDRCVLLPIDCSVEHNALVISNEVVADLCAKNPRFIGFASVDPRSPQAAAQLRAAFKDLGLKGLKLNPALQNFNPASEEIAFPIYKVCQEFNKPVLIHAGLSWAPNAQLSLAQPLVLEKALVAFPGVTFIIPHLGYPWLQETCALALKYPNLYLDTSVNYSGAPLTCLRHIVEHVIGRHVFEDSLRTKLLFGSNYPRIDMRRCVRAYDGLGFSPELKDHIFSANAQRLLGETS